MYILKTMTGFHYGPFSDAESAGAWGDSHQERDNWVLIPLVHPFGTDDDEDFIEID